MLYKGSLNSPAFSQVSGHLSLTRVSTCKNGSTQLSFSKSEFLSAANSNSSTSPESQKRVDKEAAKKHLLLETRELRPIVQPAVGPESDLPEVKSIGSANCKSND